MLGMTKIAPERPQGIKRSAALLAGISLLVLAGCQGNPELGSGGSTVSGSGGAAGAQGASSQLERCSQPLGTAALVETNSNALGLLRSVGLESPLPLLRLMMTQSNCFQVVDRGAALRNIQTEQNLQQSGMLQQGSTTARGRLVTAQYVVTPNVIFSNQNAGGSNILSSIGNYFGSGGAIAGSVAGSMRVQEAQTTLFLTDAQSGIQTAASEGSASVTDFSGRGGIRGWGSNIFGRGGLGAYGNTDEGKLIAAAFMDAHNKLVQQVRATQPNEAAVAPGARSERGNKALVTAIQKELKARGYYDSSVDGLYGRGTRGAITQYQQENNLPIDGEPSQNLLKHITGG